MAQNGKGVAGEGGYLPPQNLDAEVSVLGALMTAHNLMAGVSEVLRPPYFYRPSHQAIYEAIEELYSRGEPFDWITVSDELNTRGRLDDVGGRAYVHSLVAAVPTVSNARHYAEIVREAYLLRSLIDVGSEIVQMGYERKGQGPQQLIDRAEQMVFDIAQNRATGEMVVIGDVISDSFVELEQIMTQGRRSTGVETGFQRLDDLITGLQPANLVVLAARPSMGKTALALNIARNVAVGQGKGVLIFSLEMAARELVQRMMCAEARIDSQRLRHGEMEAAEWSKLTQACTPLYTAPVFIDDTAAVNLMEIRAKARRLKAREKNLGLIIIDYLQLMIGDSSAENRQQEVARISRGLKILARDLDVPVMALSQLSRQVEQRTNRRPLLSDLRECVTGETSVVLADGSRLPVAALVGTQPDVLSVTPEGRVMVSRSDKVWRVGRRPVFEVRLAGGRVVRATAQHRFLGSAGWTMVRDLKAGDRLGQAVRLPGDREAVGVNGRDVSATAATGDLGWDTVSAVRPAGEEDVYDLSVPGPESWLADGVVSHNSGAIEQDADVVIFIYRDEEYNKESPDKGTAEIIVSKQRNGPTGFCSLAFIKSYTRFFDMPRDGRGGGERSAAADDREWGRG